MRILWTKSGGFLPTDTGGKIRSFSIARELARRHEVTLFTFYPAVFPDPHERLGYPFVKIENIPLDLPQRATIRETLSYAANALTRCPYQIRKYCRPEVGRRLRALLGKENFDVLICDFLPAASIAPWNLGIPTVIFTHNIEAIIWQRHFLVRKNPLWKLVAWREQHALARVERELTQLADHVLTVSENDRKFFLDFLPADKVTTVPTGVDLDYFRPRPNTESSRSLVFTGSMDWPPNEDAIIYFSTQILPLIQAQVPSVVLWVVGRTPTEKVLALKKKNPAIQVTGTVDDIRPYLNDAAVYVVPLRIGGGTRIKIFEAMAMGMPVVSTRIGAEGLPVQHGQDILLSDTPDDFATSTITLLRQPELRKRIGCAARTLVESRHGWAVVTDVLEAVVHRVAKRKHGRQRGTHVSSRPK